MTIRILLVDDHTMMREGLRSLLASQADFEIVGEACDGRSAVTLARSLSPNIVIMDIGMSDMNGIEATRKIVAESRRMRVIALSTYADKRYVLNMLDAGAMGYVLKIAAYEEIVRAVRAAHAGKTYLSPEVAGLVVENSRREKETGEVTAFSTLGAREREVLQLVAEGLTSAETAHKMQISMKTVETHRRNIAKKLGLHSTAELTKYAIREGLTSLDR